MRRRILPYFLLFCFLGVCASLFHPDPARLNARRSACQSNLRQIGVAVQQYAQDYDEQLPLHRWKTPLWDYIKDERFFQCPGPETTTTPGTNDYFFNTRFIGKSLEKIASPKTLVLVGDGPDSGHDVTLFSLPPVWRTDEKSPAWRHLDTANYLFADSHVKALKVDRVNRDFRAANR